MFYCKKRLIQGPKYKSSKPSGHLGYQATIEGVESITT